MQPEIDLPSAVLSLNEVAALLRVKPRTVSDKIKAGVLPLQPVNWSKYRMLFLRVDVERLLSGQKRVGRRVA